LYTSYIVNLFAVFQKQNYKEAEGYTEYLFQKDSK